jgi:diadenosine tetraphosphatase ApaH/serine/threonine PP2A family protein phosphatase
MYDARILRQVEWMRCLILSDVHSNYDALEAVLATAPPHDVIWCLGDIVGYGPEPERCMDRVLQPATLSIAGNHDWAVVGKLDLADFNADAREANLWNRRQLDGPHLDSLRELPTTVTPEGFTLAHGSPRYPIWEYITGPSVALPNFSYFETQVCLVGHTHVPVVFRLVERDSSRYCEVERPRYNEAFPLGEQRLIINPGSVGQPRDGDPRAAFALLDTTAREFTFLRVPYAVESTQRKMEAAGLPRRLILRLAYGW